MPRRKYDRQLIVGLLQDAADAVTVQQSTDLDAKHRDEPLPSEVVFVPPNTAHGASPDDACPTLRQALRGELQVPQCVSRQSRLYLVGRGDWRARTLSGWTAAQTAALLGQAGTPAVRVISVVADELGRDLASTHATDLREPADSFAAQLHAALREHHGIETVLLARVYRTLVVGASEAPRARGTKLSVTVDETVPDEAHHRPHSKLRFFWKDGTQRREWSDS
ncbi:MAG TPA: hypothetical protein VKP66_12625 [Steroidobacteraceae bacterium]|nr:hypothetical protein [Steroidobacteraceae bacterium]